MSTNFYTGLNRSQSAQRLSKRTVFMCRNKEGMRNPFITLIEKSFDNIKLDLKKYNVG
jgi:hypothetical protein